MIDLQGNVRFLSAQSSPSDVGLVPYSRVGDYWTISDEIVLDVIGTCDAEGNFDTVFYDGYVLNHFDFLDAMQSPGNIPVFVFLGQKPAGFAWINGICGNYAFGHFCFLNALKGRSEEAGKMVLDYWFSFQSIEVIIGMVPQTNERAIKFVQRLGMTRLGSIPKMLTVQGEKSAACILYKTRP